MGYDVFILALLLFATLRGAMKGIVWQLASIGALVACFAFAETLSAKIAPHIPVKEPANRWIAMFVLYMAFSLMSFALARLLNDWIEKAKFVEYDRHLGAIFGFIKGIVFSLVLTFFVVTLSESARAHVLKTRSGKAAAVIMDQLHPVMPDELHDVLEPYIHKLDHPGLDLEHDHKDDDEHQDNHDDSPKTPEVPKDPFDILDPFSGANGSEPSDGQTDDPVDRLLNLITTSQTNTLDADKLRNVLRTILDEAGDDRDRLVEVLKSGDLDGARAVVTNVIDSHVPSSPPTPIADRDKLLREISAVYFDSTNAQSTFIEELNETLADLPRDVQVDVLRDMHADLTNGEDPFPATTFRTGLDDRIRQQLARERAPRSAFNRD